eukprot:365447-Chlamydomonas_euryale.AAC.26
MPDAASAGHPNVSWLFKVRSWSQAGFPTCRAMTHAHTFQTCHSPGGPRHTHAHTSHRTRAAGTLRRAPVPAKSWTLLPAAMRASNAPCWSCCPLAMEAASVRSPRHSVVALFQFLADVFPLFPTCPLTMEERWCRVP